MTDGEISEKLAIVDYLAVDKLAAHSRDLPGAVVPGDKVRDFFAYGPASRVGGLNGTMISLGNWPCPGS